MPDFDDAIGDMVDDLLTEAGRSVTCLRGGVAAGTITMRKSPQPSQYIDNGNGGLIEISPVDFIGKTSELLFDPPLRGDQFVVAGETFEVLPTVGEKVFRRISPQMTRIHTKQVATR